MLKREIPRIREMDKQLADYIEWLISVLEALGYARRGGGRKGGERKGERE